jgi:Na+/proline symporter
MIVFTYYGGMEAVIWVEVVQLAIYIGGAIAAAIVIANQIPNGFAGAVEVGRQFNKFDLFDFNLDFTKTFTFWSGLIGGCFLTMSTHGTDQYLVQRYLCTDKASRASFALLSSGAVVLGQFIGFLFIGVLLFAFYQPYADPFYAQVSDACAKILPEFATRCFAEPEYAKSVTNLYPFKGGDQVFPDFITKHMPTGLSGLVVAAIFAAALSSSLNSIAATAVNDLYKPFRQNLPDKHYLRVSQWLTLIVGIVQIVVALVLIKQNRSALDQALSIASLFNGPVLGVFLVGTFIKRANESAALTGMAASILLMLYIKFATNIAWTWYVLFGSLTTFLVAWLASVFFQRTRISEN